LIEGLHADGFFALFDDAAEVLGFFRIFDRFLHPLSADEDFHGGYEAEFVFAAR